MDTNCIFCKIIAGEIPSDKVFENDNWAAILDIKPVNLGHVLLIPKTHSRNLLDMPQKLLADVGSYLQKLAKAVKAAAQADGVNIIMNNEPAAGQLIMHSHFHIIPRFKNDGFEHWHGITGSTSAELAITQQKITSYLSTK